MIYPSQQFGLFLIVLSFNIILLFFYDATHSKLDVRVGQAELTQTSCLETKAEIMESVREKSVYIIQTGDPK